MFNNPVYIQHEIYGSMFFVSRVLVLRVGTVVVRNRFSQATLWHCCLYYQRAVDVSNTVLYLYRRFAFTSTFPVVERNV